MLHNIAKKCTNFLIIHGVISEEEYSIYHYGFELLWSTIFCIISILTFGYIFNYLELVVTFIVFFMPIRVVAGGYHAKSYGTCFLLTNFIAATCAFISKVLYQGFKNDFIFWCVFLICFIYIWNAAPVISQKYPLTSGRIKKNKKYAKMVLIINLLLTVFVRFFIDKSMFFTIVVTYFAVVIMMIFSEGRKPIWKPS